jgi:hypothetical protein
MTDRLRELLTEVNKLDGGCQIARTLLSPTSSLVTSDRVNYLDWESSIGEISYLPVSKEVFDNDEANFTSSSRQSMRPGRLIRSLFLVYLMDADIERFLYLLDSVVERKACFFELVSGEDIRYWYNGANYSGGDTGSLRSSCMRYDKCAPYFDVYVKNPDKIRMLIVSKPNTGKIIGRALVWTADSGETLVDRIYGRRSTVEAVKAWAKERGFWHKQYQTYDSPRKWYSPEGYRETKSFCVTIDNALFEAFPYMDTFQYISLKKKGDTAQGVLTNYSRQRDSELTFTLQNTEGYPGLSRCADCGIVRDGDGDYCYSCVQARRCTWCYQDYEPSDIVGGLCPTCQNRHVCSTCQCVDSRNVRTWDGVTKQCRSCFVQSVAGLVSCHCGNPVSSTLIEDLNGHYLCDTCIRNNVCQSCGTYEPLSRNIRSERTIRTSLFPSLTIEEGPLMDLCHDCVVCSLCLNTGRTLTNHIVRIDSDEFYYQERLVSLCQSCRLALETYGQLH